MRLLLIVLVALAACDCVLTQNSNMTEIDLCVLFKYTNSSNPTNAGNSVLKANGLYIDKMEFVINKLDGYKNTYIVFYQFIAVYNKTKNFLACEKISSYCAIRTVQRKTNMNKNCYKIKGIFLAKLINKTVKEPIGIIWNF